MTDGIGKAEGFRDETYLIVPTESFTEYMAHPLIRAAYLTDVGFFPRAREHYREREEGADQYILIYCTEGKGIIEVEGRKYHLGRSDAFCIPRHKRHRYYADEKEPWSILWVHFKGESISYYPVQECRVVHLASRASDNRMMVLFKLLFRVLERNYTLGNFIYISQVLSLIPGTTRSGVTNLGAILVGVARPAAIAAQLGRGESVPEAVRKAKAYVYEAIAHADELSVGHGHGPTNHFAALWRKGDL